MDGGGRRSPRLAAAGKESAERVQKRNSRSVSPPPPAQTGVKALLDRRFAIGPLLPDFLQKVPSGNDFAKGPLLYRYITRYMYWTRLYSCTKLLQAFRVRCQDTTGVLSTVPVPVEYRYCLLHVAWYCAALYCPCQYCAILFVRSYCSRTYYRSSRGATTLQLYRYRYFLPLLPALHVEVQRRWLLNSNQRPA